MKISKPENIDFNSLSSIIFDWGGVITNIDFMATIRAFQEIGHPTMQSYFGDKKGHDLFLRLEKGMAEPSEIYSKMVEDIGHPVPLQSLNDAFCAMILDTPAQRISILKSLRKNYKLFLLSNTNSIHTDYYRNHFRQKMNFDFADLFDKVYYSNLLGMRKPDHEIFEYVLNDARLNPHETLFIDDTEANILAAGELDIQAFHLTHEYSMENVFTRWTS
jgi:glucose-1-phosphatase